MINNAELSTKFSIFIDLNMSEKNLKSELRNSYKSLINWGNRELHPTVLDSSNITWELMNRFRLLHIHESGKETMPVEGWRYRFEMVKNNKAFVVYGSFNNELVTAGFFPTIYSHCYYGSSASKRDLFDKPLFHSILWAAILYARKIGCSWFEVGDKIYKANDKSPQSVKEKNISKFKSGFGGKSRLYLDMKLNMKNGN
jgi:hypothetical protein